MSEKQLTVAELMERAAKEGRVEAPRRRRRSLEEGGVSVAELTGSIPVVKAVPSDSRHSAEPIDAPYKPKPVESADIDETPPWLTEPPASTDLPSGSFAAVVDPPEPQQEEEEQEEELPPWLATAHDVASREEEEEVPPWLVEATRETKEPDEVPPWIITEEEEEEEDEVPPWMLPAEEEPEQPEPEELEEQEEEETPPWLVESTPSTDKTMVISVVNENDPVRLTTGAFEAITPEQAQAAQTTVEELEAPVERPDIASVIPMGGQVPVRERDRRNAPANTGPIPGPAPSAAETQVQPVVEPLPVKKVEKEGKVSFLAIAGMTLLAIAIGVALFLGFEMLWRNLSGWVVSLLALAVTGAIVGIVHALRTERDFLSMGLAGLAGLAMTFGPMAVAGL